MNKSSRITPEHQAHNPNVVTPSYTMLFLYFYTEKGMLIPQQNPKYTFGHQLVVYAHCIEFRKKLPCQQKTKATTSTSVFSTSSVSATGESVHCSIPEKSSQEWGKFWENECIIMH